MTSLLQHRCFDWVMRTFGSAVATDVKERAARVAEEAIELAQVEGISAEMVKAIVDRVYARPPGDARQEVAGVEFTLAVYAFVREIDPEIELVKELQRVEGMPPEHFRKKHREKQEAGITIQETI